MISMEKTEAKIPIVTTWLAFCLPYISEIISVIKKVMGYGKIPTDIWKVYHPKKLKLTNF
jgi:hypothetical protein